MLSLTKETNVIRSLRLFQILKSIPHYLLELQKLHSLSDFLNWLQYKKPSLFALPDFPPRITLELTNHCNFTCRHCHRNVMNRDLGLMEYALFEKLINEISNYPSTIVKIGGLGEPSLHKDCPKALELLRERKVKYIFYTNGTLLHNVGHEEILEWEISHLVVSIDGIDAESYSNIRIGGDYGRLRADLQAFYRRRNELGIKKPMIEVRHVILPNETSAQITKFKKMWKEVADTVMYCHYIPSEPLVHGTSSQPRACRDIMRELYIRWNGAVPLCGYQYLSGEQEWIADINNVSIQEAWHVPKLQELRICHSRDSSNIPGFCRTCVRTL